MEISEDQVRYIAGLANLELTPDEIQHHRKDLAEILTYVDKLSELLTDDVEPMTHVVYPGSKNYTLREDELKPSLGVESALANAPESGAGHFKVPRVIER